MTQKEIIWNVRNLISSGRVSGYEKLSDRQVAFIIDYYRAFLIRNDIEKGRTINSVINQAMELSLKVDGSYWKYEKLPTPLELHKSTAITYVGWKERQYQLTTHSRIEFDKYSKYTSKEPKWWLLGRDLFVANPIEKHMVKVRVRGIFERPIEVEKINGTYNPHDEFNFHYPIPANMLNQMYEMIVNKELRITIPQVEEDES